MGERKRIPMDAELKAKWIEALESGKYQKAKNQLRNDQNGAKRRMCCLGVLCDVIDPDGWRDTVGNCHYTWEGAGGTGDIIGGLGPGDKRFHTAADLNDTHPGYPIDYIKENF